MKFQLSLISLFFLLLTLFSCSKDKNSDIDDPYIKAVQGFWKGSTSPMETSAPYAVGVSIKKNGRARSYVYFHDSSFPTDTSQPAILKCDGTYLITSDSVFITCTGTASSFVYQAKVNTDFTTLQGKLMSSLFGKNLTVTMNK
jgi:hypothetical protein